MKSVIPDYDPDKNRPRCPLCEADLDDNWRIAGIRYSVGAWIPVVICRDNPECWTRRAELKDEYTSITTEEGGDNARRWHYTEAAA